MVVTVAGCTSSTVRKPTVSRARACLGSQGGGRLEVVNARPQTADGMPAQGQTTRHRVEAVLRDKRTDILARCEGATAVAMEPGFGRVWEGENGGVYRIVETNDDYALIVTLRSARYIPAMPPSYDGVPVHFRVAEHR